MDERARHAEAQRRADVILSWLFRAGCDLPLGTTTLPDLGSVFAARDALMRVVLAHDRPHGD